MKKIFFFIILSLSLFPLQVSAHAVGQPPFLKINGLFAGYYNVTLASSYFNLPQDEDASTHLVGDQIGFTIETSALGIPVDIVNHSRFVWDFGDGSSGTGTANTHVYRKSGPYILTIQAAYANDPLELIESAHITILPSPSYQLPRALLSVNGQSVIDPLRDTPHLAFADPIHLDGSASTGVGPLKYIWDSGDNHTGTDSTFTSNYSAAAQVMFPILRVVDSNGFYSDTYAQIYNTGQPATPVTPTPPPLPSYFKNIKAPPTPTSRTLRDLFTKILNTTITNPLVFFFVLLLVFIAGGLHALTPGHGKGIMSAFLIGKKGSNLWDVFWLAASITLTHTLVIFILGFIFLWIDQRHTLTDVLPYFEKGGALVVILLAVRLIWQGINHLRSHHHNHDHDHDHDYIHPSRNNILLAGFSGGLVPCTDAFALLLLLASDGKVGLGIFYVVIFSLGLSLTIVAIGFILVLGKHTFSLDRKLGHLADTWAPIISGLILVVIAARLLFP